MKYISSIVIFVGILLFQGCANQPSTIKAMKEFKSIEKNNITMLRNYNYIGGGAKFWPLVNGQEVSGLYKKEHISFQLTQGTYMLGVRCYDPLFPMKYTDEIEISIENDQSKYFLLSIAFLSGCAEIEEIDELEALNRLEDSIRITTGKVSDCNSVSINYADYEQELCFSNMIP